jgi:hypothetical protein
MTRTQFYEEVASVTGSYTAGLVQMAIVKHPQEPAESIICKSARIAAHFGLLALEQHPALCYDAMVSPMMPEDVWGPICEGREVSR